MRIDLSFLNSEWYREELSTLETTLRLPEIFKQALYLFVRRWLVPVFGFNLAFLYLLKLWRLHLFLIFTIQIFLIACILILEHLTARAWWLNKVLPIHLKNVALIKSLCEKSQSGKQVCKSIEKSIKLSSWGIIRTVYYGIYTYSWELILRVWSPIMVKRLREDYRVLLIGFTNKITEADSKLWEISKEKDGKKKDSLLRQYLDDFGSRTVDADLKHPTLREQPEAVESLLTIYRTLPDNPEEIVKKAALKRGDYEKKFKNNLRFNLSTPIFTFILKQTQENVKQRENRRFYEFLADYYIRTMILRLASKINLKEPGDIFNLKWKDIKNLAKDE